MAEIELSRGDLGSLPSLCLCCGAPAEVWQQRSYELTENESGSAGFGLISRILELIRLGQSFLREKLVLRAPFCQAHRNHWRHRKYVIIGSIGSALALLLFSLWMMKGFNPGDDKGLVFLGIGFGSVLVAGVTAAVAHETSVHATLVTPKAITLKGVSDKFVQAMSGRR